MKWENAQKTLWTDQTINENHESFRVVKKKRTKKGNSRNEKVEILYFVCQFIKFVHLLCFVISLAPHIGSRSCFFSFTSSYNYKKHTQLKCLPECRHILFYLCASNDVKPKCYMIWRFGVGSVTNATCKENIPYNYDYLCIHWIRWSLTISNLILENNIRCVDAKRFRVGVYIYMCVDVFFPLRKLALKVHLLSYSVF